MSIYLYQYISILQFYFQQDVAWCWYWIKRWHINICLHWKETVLSVTANFMHTANAIWHCDIATSRLLPSMYSTDRTERLHAAKYSIKVHPKSTCDVEWLSYHHLSYAIINYSMVAPSFTLSWNAFVLSTFATTEGLSLTAREWQQKQSGCFHNGALHKWP